MKTNDLKDINSAILIVTVFFYITIKKYLPVGTNNVLIDVLIGYLTSFGFYKIFISIVYWAFNNVEFLLKLYYNKSYYKGVWSYVYSLNGKIYFGIWNIKQNLDGINVIGYGLNIDGTPRSDVRSVSQLIYNKGAYEILNFREDAIDSGKENYSKTVLIPIYGKRKWYGISYPKIIRSKTYIYGSKLAGNIHNDVEFKKHEDVDSEEDVKKRILDEIKNKYKEEQYLYQ